MHICSDDSDAMLGSIEVFYIVWNQSQLVEDVLLDVRPFDAVEIVTYIDYE